jgi:hypothetical protein
LGNVRSLSIENVERLSGVFYMHLDVDKPEWQDRLEQLCKQRSYKNRDEVCKNWSVCVPHILIVDCQPGSFAQLRTKDQNIL